MFCRTFFSILLLLLNIFQFNIAYMAAGILHTGSPIKLFCMITDTKISYSFALPFIIGISRFTPWLNEIMVSVATTPGIS